MLDLQERRAVALYEAGHGLDACAAAAGLTDAEVLHAVGLTRRAKRTARPECAGCPWRQGDQPCVWPRGMCEIRR